MQIFSYLKLFSVVVAIALFGLLHVFGLPGSQSDRNIAAAIAQQIATTETDRLAGSMGKLAAGDTHSCAVTTSGGLRCWGATGAQLGAGKDDSGSATLLDVVGLQADVSAVVVGKEHSCALVTGDVQCWGTNFYGQLGNGTTDLQLVPTAVISLPNDIAAITTGYFHSCALSNAGRVACWGNNSAGQLGNDTQIDSATPVAVVGLTDNVLAIGAGGHTTCAVTDAHAVLCWGANDSGNVGDGTTIDRLTPVAVQNVPALATAVAVGPHHACARLSDGRVFCWGLNNNQQLGTGAGAGQFLPAPVIGLNKDVVAISAARWHTCALLVDTRMHCWGSNQSGMLGDGSRVERAIPVQVAGLNNQVSAIAAGRQHSCAMQGDGEVFCWGNNEQGQIGNGEIANIAPPVTVANVGARNANLATGGHHSCALADGGVRCWGSNEFGQLGDNTLINRFAAVPNPRLQANVNLLAAGANHTCALTVGDAVQCWGQSWYGQLGNGQLQDSRTPVAVAGLQSGVRAIAATADHSCALLQGGEAWCWGANDWGQLGSGDNSTHVEPVNVQLVPAIKQIAPGNTHTCAVTTAGLVYCWGKNGTKGQLGNGTTEHSLIPVQVANLSDIQAVASGSAHTCALRNNGAVACWGANDHQQLGFAGNHSPLPVTVPGVQTIQSIAVGDTHSCALTDQGHIQCWGDNRRGQLGDGSAAVQTAPITVTIATTATAIVAGGKHSCALLANGSVQCWGWRASGQVGDNEERYLTPVAVAGFAPPPIATTTPTPLPTSSATPSPTPSATRAQGSRTLVLIYAGLDNNLGSADNWNRLINQLESGVHDTLDVRLLIDAPGVDNSFVYDLIHDDNLFCPSTTDMSCGERYRTGERRQLWREDTAHPQSLYDFVTQGLAAFPQAEHIVLAVLGHGSGWSANGLPSQPSGWRDQADERLGGMLWDDTLGDDLAGSRSLSTQALGAALHAATTTAGRKLDLLYLDACSMAMAEVAYEVRSAAHYLLASPNTKWASFPYGELLRNVTPAQDGRTIGTAWLQIEGDRLRPNRYPFTFTLFDLAQMADLKDAVSTLAADLTAVWLQQSTQIRDANIASERYESNYDGLISAADSYVALNDFAEHLSDAQVSTSVTQSAQAVQQALGRVVVAKDKRDGIPWLYPDQLWQWPNYGGVSIYLPALAEPAKQLLYTNENLAWAQDSEWDEFLQIYWGNARSASAESAPHQQRADLPTCVSTGLCEHLLARQLHAQSVLFLPVVVR